MDDGPPAGAAGPLVGASGLAVRFDLASRVKDIEVTKNATPSHTVVRVKALAALRPCIMPLRPPGPCPWPKAPPSEGCKRTMPTSAKAISKCRTSKKTSMSDNHNFGNRPKGRASL
jgi:hypothetical protein